MDRIKKLLRAGCSLATATREVLEMTSSDFAAKYQLNRQFVSSALHGRVRPDARLVAAMIAEFGGSDYEWRLLFWEAGRPQPASETAARVA